MFVLSVRFVDVTPCQACSRAVLCLMSDPNTRRVKHLLPQHRKDIGTFVHF